MKFRPHENRHSFRRLFRISEHIVDDAEDHALYDLAGVFRGNLNVRMIPGIDPEDLVCKRLSYFFYVFKNEDNFLEFIHPCEKAA